MEPAQIVIDGNTVSPNLDVVTPTPATIVPAQEEETEEETLESLIDVLKAAEELAKDEEVEELNEEVEETLD